jgi:hypothetical protein
MGRAFAEDEDDALLRNAVVVAEGEDEALLLVLVPFCSNKNNHRT